VFVEKYTQEEEMLVLVSGTFIVFCKYVRRKEKKKD